MDRLFKFSTVLIAFLSLIVAVFSFLAIFYQDEVKEWLKLDSFVERSEHNEPVSPLYNNNEGLTDPTDREPPVIRNPRSFERAFADNYQENEFSLQAASLSERTEALFELGKEDFRALKRTPLSDARGMPLENAYRSSQSLFALGEEVYNGSNGLGWIQNFERSSGQDTWHYREGYFIDYGLNTCGESLDCFEDLAKQRANGFNELKQYYSDRMDDTWDIEEDNSQMFKAVKPINNEHEYRIELFYSNDLYRERERWVGLILDLHVRRY